ncbi:MAG: GNAT family N-acetyltransferase [Thermoplasmatales archaeon B_DKE]|nr:MAG: GNAT family N-acetyltransferase [Thermoplasmatales archaeon B_DKE]
MIRLEDNVKVRRMRPEDMESVIDMVRRLKKINEEFDSSFIVRDDIKTEAENYLNDTMKDQEKYILLVAELKKKVVGIIKVDVLERICYEPRHEARIVEFYVMPEYRRKKVGHALMDEVSTILKKRGISLISAEFPSLNLIALGFYKKNGYRDLVSIYGKQISDEDEK